MSRFCQRSPAPTLLRFYPLIPSYYCQMRDGANSFSPRADDLRIARRPRCELQTLSRSRLCMHVVSCKSSSRSCRAHAHATALSPTCACTALHPFLCPACDDLLKSFLDACTTLGEKQARLGAGSYLPPANSSFSHRSRANQSRWRDVGVPGQPCLIIKPHPLNQGIDFFCLSRDCPSYLTVGVLLS